MEKQALENRILIAFLIAFAALAAISTLAETETPSLLCSDTDPSNSQYKLCDEAREDILKNPVYSAQGAATLDSMLTAVSTDNAVLESGQASGSVTVMTLNVGTAAFRIDRSGSFPISLSANCPNFKLCDPKIIEGVREHLRDANPDVLFLQEAQGVEQVLGAAGPLLSTDYEAVCSFGHRGVQENCLAWKKSKARLAGLCKSILTVEGSAVSCPLEIDGLMIQFVSAHPSAWYGDQRAAITRGIWSKLLDRTRPAVVGGDFNTQEETLGFSSEYPYPAEFGTVFGRHVKGYGRWSPEDSFFGHYHLVDGKKSAVSHRTTVLMTKIDQIFANFGEPTELESACRQTSCLGGKDAGYPYPFAKWGLLGPPADHRPVLSRISWNKSGSRP